jgi:hypothetical protein
VAFLGLYFVAFIRDRFVVVASQAEPLEWLVLVPGVLSLVLAVGGWAAGPRRVATHAALVTLALAWGWGLGVGQAQAQADYYTSYYYGSYGNREAAAYLDEIDGTQEPYIAAKDVAWYARNKNYIDQDSFWYAIVEEHRPFDGTFNGYPIRIVVVFARDPFARQVYYDATRDRYDLVKVLGEYAVLVRKPDR